MSAAAHARSHRLRGAGRHPGMMISSSAPDPFQELALIYSHVAFGPQIKMYHRAKNQMAFMRLVKDGDFKKVEKLSLAQKSPLVRITFSSNRPTRS